MATSGPSALNFGVNARLALSSGRLLYPMEWQWVSFSIRNDPGRIVGALLVDVTSAERRESRRLYGPDFHGLGASVRCALTRPACAP